MIKIRMNEPFILIDEKGEELPVEVRIISQPAKEVLKEITDENGNVNCDSIIVVDTVEQICCECRGCKDEEKDELV